MYCMKEKQIKQIQSLKNEGRTFSQIAKLLDLPQTSVRYHYDPKYKKDSIKRSRKYRCKEPLQPKANDFFSECPEDRDFTLEDVNNKFSEPTCYLTGTPINLKESTTYSLDHITPLSQGGRSNLDNMGLLRKDANQAKYDKTPEEFIQLCIEVLRHNGYKVTEGSPTSTSGAKENPD